MTLDEAIAATFAVVGQEIADLGLRVVIDQLATYPLPHVMTALHRCQRECRRLTLADILERLPGQQPGPEEGWAMLAQALGDEGRSVVWTDQMAAAFAVAYPLRHDMVAARMAFKEAYTRAVRAVSGPPVWKVSLGWDPAGREAAIQEAAERNALALPPPTRPLLPEGP